MRSVRDEAKTRTRSARGSRRALLAKLARRARDGDQHALDHLLGLLTDDIAYWARRQVNPTVFGSALAEEAANSALLTIARQIRLLEDSEKVVGWAFTITRRRALDLIDAEARRGTPLHRRLDDQLELAPGRLSAEAELELRELLNAARAELSPRRREIVTLCLEEQLKQGQAADVLGCSTGAIKKELHVARDQLMRALQERGVEPSTVTPARTRRQG